MRKKNRMRVAAWAGSVFFLAAMLNPGADATWADEDAQSAAVEAPQSKNETPQSYDGVDSCPCGMTKDIARGEGKGRKAERRARQGDGPKAGVGMKQGACGAESRQGMGKGARGNMSGQGHGGPEMSDARTLVGNYQSITRHVEEIPGGVRTITTTTDPDLLDTLRRHPREMMDRLEGGRRVRHWDPLFAEIVKYTDKIRMVATDIPNGIEVVETSDDPEVAKLIVAHAYKVSEFAERGMKAMHELTPLPEGYAPAAEPASQ